MVDFPHQRVKVKSEALRPRAEVTRTWPGSRGEKHQGSWGDEKPNLKHKKFLKNIPWFFLGGGLFWDVVFWKRIEVVILVEEKIVPDFDGWSLCSFN